jgi:hypothetical protein
MAKIPKISAKRTTRSMGRYSIHQRPHAKTLNRGLIMKCQYCDNQTNTYQKYHTNAPYVSPFCQYHLNSRVKYIFTVPNHIPDAQHQLYLWQKYTQFTNWKDYKKNLKYLKKQQKAKNLNSSL